MPDGTNTKVLQSRRALAGALISLMQEQPYAKITVQDICARAGVSRQTFYNVCETKEEILRFYLRSVCEEVQQQVPQEELPTLNGVVKFFSLFMEGYQDLLKRMIENQLSGIITEEISRVIRSFAVTFLQKDDQDELFLYSEAMLTGALSGMVVLWLSQETPIEMDRLKQLLRDFLAGRLYQFPEK